VESILVGKDFPPQWRILSIRDLILSPLRVTLAVRWIWSRVGLILSYHRPLISILYSIWVIRLLNLLTLDVRRLTHYCRG